jgi:hypothetical protein
VSRMTSGRFLLSGMLLAAFLAAEVCAGAATNLVVNGGFESADPADPRRPVGWALPDGLGARWERGADGGHAIWLDTRISEAEMARQWRLTGLTNLWDIPKPAGNAIADTYGLSYYSTPFPVVSGQVYRVRCDVYGAGGVKVWVRGYGLFRGRLTKRYEAMMNCHGGAGVWTPNAMAFNPTRRRPEVTEMRVMLYAYYPPGRYGFDNVVVEPVPDALGGAETN